MRQDKVGGEFLRNYLRIFMNQRKLSNSLVSLLVLALIAIMISTNLLIQFTSKNEQFESLNKSTYSLSDSLFGKDEDDFFSRTDGVLKIKSLYHKLLADESFEYGVLTKQPIYIPDLDLDMKFFEGYGQRPIEYLVNNSYNSIQINAVVLEHSAINLIDGRVFNEDEYSYEAGKTLPVLIGYELKEFFNLNDSLLIGYLGKQIQYEVVGFLEKDSYMVDRNRNTVFLDRYFVLPAIDCVNDPVGGLDHEFQKRVYLQNTNGIIYSDLSSIVILDKIQRYCEELDIEPPYVLIGLPNVSFLGLKTKEIVIIFAAISILLLIISIAAIMINLLSKTDMMLKCYSIHYICGAKKKTILSFILLEVFLAMLIGMIVVYLLQYLFYSNSATNWYLVASILLVLVLIPIPSLIKIYNMNIPEQIRR